MSQRRRPIRNGSFQERRLGKQTFRTTYQKTLE